MDAGASSQTDSGWKLELDLYTNGTLNLYPFPADAVEQTDSAMRALKQLLQLPGLLDDDDNSVSETAMQGAMERLSTALRDEKKRVQDYVNIRKCVHPAGVLLNEGRGCCKFLQKKLEWLEGLLSRYCEAASALEREEAASPKLHVTLGVNAIASGHVSICLTTKTLPSRAEQVAVAYIQASKSVNDSVDELEDARNNLSRARKRHADSERITRLEEELHLAKTSARDAERQLHAERVKAVAMLGEFSELQLLMERMVPAPLLPLFRHGRTLDHYATRKPIEKPSRNTLYEATLLNDDGTEERRVVLKEYRTADAAMLRTCYHEASMLQRCRHHAVVQLEAIFAAEGFFYLQMPFYANGTLLEYCLKRQPSARALIELLLPLCQALAHLHLHSVVHSDVKPQNILVDDCGTPRLADFDVSQSCATRKTLAFAQTTVAVGIKGGGTLGYLAPEVQQGGASQLTEKSDVFSLGVTFEEVALKLGVLSVPVAGSRPLFTDELTTLLRQLLTEEVAVRPAAADAVHLVHDALRELDRREAAAMRVELERKLKGDLQEREREVQQLREALERPKYWSNSTASQHGAQQQGVSLVPLDRASQQEVLAQLQKLLDTDSRELSKGQDLKEPSASTYDNLRLARAWRIENAALWDKYAGGRASVKVDTGLIAASGKAVAVEQSRTHDIGCQVRLPNLNAVSAGHLPSLTGPRFGSRTPQLPGGLNDDANEALLLHGTRPSLVLDILSTGLNEHFSGASSGTAFGNGIYFSDDAGKCDHYVMVDTRYDPSSPLHRRLYPSQHHATKLADAPQPPPNTYYLFVCRVALGQPVRTKTKFDSYMCSMDTNEYVFAANSGSGVRTMRELNTVAGVDPPVRHHSLIAEGHARGGPYRYREYVAFQSSFVYPEYVIAYQRCRGSQPL